MRANAAGRKNKPIEKSPTKQNPKRQTADANTRGPRQTKSAGISVAANADNAVSSTGVRIKGSTLRPLISIRVAVVRTGSLAVPPNATDSP